MKYARKPLSLLLSLLMILSLFNGMAVAVSADDDPGLVLTAESGEEIPDGDGQPAADPNSTDDSGTPEGTGNDAGAPDDTEGNPLAEGGEGDDDLLGGEPGHTHSLISHEAAEATCGKDGSSAYYSCDCGKFFSDAEGTVEIEENSWVIPASGEHTDVKKNETNASGKDGLCDVCGTYCNRAPVVKEGVVNVTESVVVGEAYLLRDLQTGKIFEDPDGDVLSVAGGGSGNAESKTCFYYNRSADGGETWSEELDFASALFGATTISLTEREAGTYLYRFYAKDGFGGDSRDVCDYWYLTLNVDAAENLNFDIQFYIGQDQNFKTNGGVMPVIKLWASDGHSNKVGDEIALTDAEPENNYARVNASVPGGWYVYEGYGWNTETEAYDIPLGGMQIKLPADSNVDGAAGGGTNIYLRVMSIYTSSKKVDSTFFGAEDYTVRVTCPIMQCDATVGAPYQDGNYAKYPVLFYAGGNSCLFNYYLYPTDTEHYMFSQSINATLATGTSVINKTGTINAAELLSFTVPESANFALYFQANNFNTSEQAPSIGWTSNDDGTKTASYKVPKSNANYSWRMTDPNGVYVTKAGWLTAQQISSQSITLTFDGASTDRNSHSFAGLGKTTATRDEADLQVFVSATGAKAVSGTERFRAYRMWQLINSDTANIMIEPDYVWTKLTGPADISFAEDSCGEITGSQIDGGNSFHNWADITANGGTSIFAVHYKALDVDLTNATHGGFYPATNPDRTAFVVIADSLGSATANVQFNGDFTGNSRLPGWDYIYDTWYYLNGEENPALTFTTAGAETVEYAFGLTDNSLQSTVTGFTAITAADGVYSVPLAALNNGAYNYGGTVIIRMTDASGAYSYQLVKVARMSVTVTNKSFPGEPVMPGNTVILGFDGLYRSINKISGIFNPTTFYLRYTMDGKEVNGITGQYQQMDTSSITLTIPSDITIPEGEDTTTVTATNGYVFGSMYSAANPFSAMYYMTDVGVGTNFNAVTVSFAFQKLSDVPITVSKMPTVDVTLNVVGSDSASVTVTDATGAAQTAENGVYTLGLGTFKYSVEADGFIMEKGSFAVSAADGKTKTVTVTLRPVDEKVWDGTAKAAVTPNASGVYEIGTGAELAWFAAQVNSGAGVAYNAMLTDDISLNWKAWTPIGTSTQKYTGTFDGNGHVVTDLYINATVINQGLFGYINAATVKNLGVTGSVISTNNNVGGIVGYAAGASVIENCFNAAEVTGKQCVGGIVGYNVAAAKVDNCYNAGDITATAKYAGGINGCGTTVSICAIATNCYNVGTVNSAASGGGINPGGAAKAVNSYYLDTCYVTGTSAKAGTAKTADELKAMAATLGEAFVADTTGINGGYPILKWQQPEEPAHEHSFGAWTSADENDHARSCACGETETEAHVWDEGVITTEATCTKDGVKTFTCSICEGTRTEAVPAAGHVDAGFDGVCDVCETVLGTVKTVNVSFTAQAAGAFLCAPAENAPVASNLAESYGYTDGIDYLTGVSALDVLVAANIAVVGEEDFAAAPKEFLTAGASVYGFSVTKLFGVLTTNNGFAINRGCPNDGTASPYGGYNGYVINTAPVEDGDLVEFFLYQDDYAADNYTYVTVAENALEGVPFTVNVKGISYGWRGYEFLTPEAMKAAASPIEGISLAIVDKQTGALTDLEVETDEDGNVSITVAEAGTVILTAYGEDDTETPVIMTMTEIEVAHVHKFGEWTNTDENGHSHTCACGEIETEEHVWNEGEVTAEATCTEEGVMTYTCAVCEAAKTEVTPAVGHTEGEPVCTSSGNGQHVITVACTVCGEALTTETEDCTLEDEVVEPTCLEKGYTIHKCSVEGCGYTFTDTETEALGHEFGEDNKCIRCDARYLTPVPDAVSEAEPLVNADGVHLVWTAVPGAEGYQILRRTSAKGAWNLIGDSNTAEFTDVRVTNGTTYYYAVVPYNADVVGEQILITVKYLTVCTPKLTNTDTGIKVAWSSNSKAGGYIVSRSADGGQTWTVLKTIKSYKTISYLDTAVESGVDYVYSVQPFSGTYMGQIRTETERRLNQVAVTVVSTDTSHELNWTEAAGADHYMVLYRTSTSGKWESLAWVKGSSYSWSGCSKSATYYYSVCAVSGSSTSATSKAAGAVCLKVPELKLTNVAKGVKISWPKDTKAAGYYVYRLENGEFVQLKKITKNSTVSFTDTTAESGKTYTYMVRAYKGSVMSFRVPGVSVTFLGTSKPALTAVKGEIQISWEAVNGAVRYDLYRKAGSGKWIMLQEGITGTSFTDTTAKKGTSYSYYVKAVGADGSVGAYTASKTVKAK